MLGKHEQPPTYSKLMVLVFLGSFLTYLEPLSQTIQLLPIIGLTVIAILGMIRGSHATKTLSASSVFNLNSAPVVLTVPLTAIGVSLTLNDDGASTLNSLVLLICLISAKIIVDTKGLGVIIRSFFIAGVLCLLFVAGFKLPEVWASLTQFQRLALYSFHPNLLAFIVAGYIGAFAYGLMRGGIARVVAFIGTIFGVSIIFSTQSRGSLVALVMAASAVIFLFVLLNKNSDKRIGLGALAFLFLLMSGLFSMLIIFPNAIIETTSKISDYFHEALQLNSEYRGLDSGLTGRQEIWATLISNLNAEVILFGTGYRSSSTTFGTIDNGYLVVLYEMGAISLLIILARFISVFRTLFESITKNPSARALSIASIFMLMTFLANNIVARYLIAVGNPFSLLCIFYLVANKKNLFSFTASIPPPEPQKSPTAETLTTSMNR